MALFSQRYYHRRSSPSDKTSVSVLVKKHSSNNFSMTYWLVLLLLDSFIEVACIITNYPGDSIDCQSELSLQYLYSGKNEYLFVCEKQKKEMLNLFISYQCKRYDKEKLHSC